MKKLILLLLLIPCLSQSGFSQVSRTNTKKSIVYKANYQRVTSSGGGNQTFEIRQGTLWAWGQNDKGQLGDGSIIDKKSPVQIGTDNKWISITAGPKHTAGIKSDGTQWAWGDNTYGELGDGTLVQKNSPVQVGTDNKWVSVIACNSHNFGLKSDGTLWAWGQNLNGILGDGTTVQQNVPVLIGTENNWVSIAGGNMHVLALKANGTLWAWGDNAYGQLGDLTTVRKSSPVQIGTENMWASIDAGEFHSVAIKSDGTLWAWGYNGYGAVGDASLINKTAPTKIGQDNQWVSLGAGGYQSFALKSNGTLWGWGYNIDGELGDLTNVNKNVPVQIGTDNKWVSITGGYSHSLGAKADGTLWAWGYNANGQLGDGTLLPKNTPVLVGTDNKWLSLSAGGTHTLGLKSNGTIWAWGDNSSGQLGDATTVTGRTFPVQTGTDTKWISIAAGGSHSLGLKSDGTLWAWGNNSNGQLGDLTLLAKNSPVQVGTDNKWVSIAAGGSHSLGLKSDGTLWSWGNNVNGQLGDASILQKTSPVQVGIENRWVSISAGSSHSLGLKSDGTLWAWGNNTSGQLGDNSTLQRNSPIQIPDNRWVSMGAGGSHSLGLKSDGTLWTWGNNSNGQLGSNFPNNRSIPMQLSDNKWVSIASGDLHSFGLKSDGILWDWGMNANGQLGTGPIQQVTLPGQVSPADNRWVSIAAGTTHSIGLRSDRNQYCGTGNNIFGRLGDGTTLSKNNFVCNGGVNCISPAAPSASGVTICSGSTASLSATGTGSLYWYNVPNGGTILSSVTPYVTPALTSTTTYYVESATCASSATRTPVMVTVNPLPVVGPISGPTVVCPGAVTYSVPSHAGSSYTWSVGNNAQITSGQGTSTVNVSVSSAYTSGNITVTETSSGCSSQTSLAVNINPQYSNVPTQISGPASICEGQTALYSISNPNASSSYSWQVLLFNNLLTGQGTQMSVTYDHSTSGNVLIRVTETSVCGTNIIDFFTNATLLPNNSLTISGTTPICPGKLNNTFTVSNSVAGRTYHWTVPTGATITSGQGTPAVSVDWGSVAGPVTVSEATLCGTGAVNSFAVGLNLPNNALVVSGNSPICAGAASNVFTVTNPSPGLTYNWSVPSDASIVSGQGTTAITVNWGSTAGSVTVSETNSCGTGAIASLAVGLIPSPDNGLVISGPNNVCVSSAGNVFTVLNPASGAIYNWTVPSDASIVSGQGTTSITVTWGSVQLPVNVSETTVCGITGSISSFGPAIIPLPRNTLTLTGPTSPICAKTNNVFTVTTTGSGRTYNWTVPAGCSIVSGQGTKVLTVTWGTTAGPVTVSESTLCGTGAINSYSVTVNPYPVITSFAPVSGREGSTVVLTGTGFTGTVSVNFKGISATNFTIDNDNQITVVVPAGGNSGVIGITSSLGCASYSTGNYIVFSCSGSTYAYVSQWGSNGTGDGQFSTPTSICMDASGNVYVADGNRIQKFNSNGTFITKWGSPGTGNGQFNAIRGLAVDGTGNVYAGELGNDRIQKFTSTGAYITQWGTTGWGNGQFQDIGQIAVDGAGNVYAVDASKDNVQKFTNTGAFITQWGGFGTTNGLFDTPKGIAIDGAGNIFVSDDGNDRIQKFSNTGTYISQWFVSSGSQIAELTIDGSGNVFVVNISDMAVWKYSSSGTYLTKAGGSYGTGNGQLEVPYSAAVDANCNLYVTDQGNDRIEVFGLSRGLSRIAALDPDPMITETAPVVQVYPNPNQGEINVLFPGKDNYDLVLYNSLGEEVLREIATSENYTIADRSFPDGVYILYVTAGEQVNKIKLVMMR
jgi:alpha-tubulin suppressor-like RCC1 family protein